MQRGTSRVLSRLPRSFSARVASTTNVLRGLPAAVRSQKDLGSRGLGVRSASTDQGRLILRREVASTLASWNYRGLLLLRDADGRSLFDSLVHFLGAEQRPDRHAREPSHVGTQLRGGCRDFVGVADNRVGGGRAVIEKPEFELSPDRFDKFGDTCLERCRRLFLQIFQTFGGGQGRFEPSIYEGQPGSPDGTASPRRNTVDSVDVVTRFMTLLLTIDKQESEFRSV